MAEPLVRSLLMLALAGPLVGCGEEAAVSQNEAAAAPANAARPMDPAEAAQLLVRRRLGGNAEIRFGEARHYKSGTVDVVCGSYSAPGAANQRYIAVVEAEAWLEREMPPGGMDRHVAEFCKDRANA